MTIDSANDHGDLCRCRHGTAEHDLGRGGCCWASDDDGEWCYCLAFEEVAWGEFEDRISPAELHSGRPE